MQRTLDGIILQRVLTFHSLEDQHPREHCTNPTPPVHIYFLNTYYVPSPILHMMREKNTKGAKVPPTEPKEKMVWAAFPPKRLFRTVKGRHGMRTPGCRALCALTFDLSSLKM